MWQFRHSLKNDYNSGGVSAFADLGVVDDLIDNRMNKA